MFRLITILITLFSVHAGYAGEVRVAVAANFTAPMKKIAAQFESTSGDRLIISYGSTGKLYAQIVHHAPFDVFLAADQERPGLLIENGLADDQFTYAIGKLVLWSHDESREMNATTLSGSDFDRIAMANPKTAPYGAAATAVLRRLDLDESMQSKIVYGDSIAQTFQFVASGNVDLGFVAKSQIALRPAGKSWEIPQEDYPLLRQDAVLLERGRDNPASLKFMTYLQQTEARKVIQSYGYGLD